MTGSHPWTACNYVDDDGVSCRAGVVFGIRARSSAPVEDDAQACEAHVGALLGSVTEDPWGSYGWTVWVL